MVLSRLKNIFKKKSPYVESIIEWQTLFDSLIGYADPKILDKVKESTAGVISGLYAYERDSVTFSQVEFAWPELSCLLFVATKKEGVLNVLDFGGALGSMYFQNRKILNGLNSIKWSIVEQSEFVLAGRSLMKNGPINFYSRIEDAVQNESPNLAIFSSSMQYLRNSEEIVREINDSNIDYVYINKTPIIESSEDVVVVQHIPKQIYNASYPMKIFSRDRFLNGLWEKWDPVISYINKPEGICETNQKKSFMYESFLLQRK